MRHSSGGRRSRNRGDGNSRGKRNKQSVYDSNGPEVRVRGTAHQVRDKYLALAKDASSTGNDVLYQSYLQHAEHYERVLNDWEDTIRNEGSDTSHEQKSRGDNEGYKQSRSSNKQIPTKTKEVGKELEDA